VSPLSHGPLLLDRLVQRGVVRDNKEVNQFLASQTTLGHVGLPDDIGGVVASLLADDNHWITGQRIEVSGSTFLRNRNLCVGNGA
jgi:hypothetical protein